MNQSGEYNPTDRPTVVNTVVVANNVTARLQTQHDIVDQANRVENLTEVTLENQGDTAITIQLQETADKSATGSRANVGAAQALVVGGTVKYVVYPTKKYLEIKSTSGNGNVKVTLNSKIRWQQLAFAKTDTFYPTSTLVNDI